MDKKQDWKNLIDKPFPDIGPITDDIREQTTKYIHRIRGSVRIALGRFFTDEEYELYRNNQLKPLP